MTADTFYGKMLRFGLVGTACAIVFFFINYMMLNFFGLGVFFSLVITYFSCFFMGYILQKNVAFRSDSRHSRSLPRYAMLHLGGFVFVYFVTEYLARVLPRPDVSAPLAATFFCGLISFFISVSWVFADHPAGHGSRR